MKKFLFILFCLISIINLKFTQAQIVLDVSDLPMINEVQVTTIVDSNMADTLSPGIAGANRTWDYSNLFYCCVDITNTRWVNSQYTANAAFFPEANIAQKSQCYFYHDWNTHVVTEICNYRDYYIKDTTGLKYIGSDYPNPHKISYFRNIFPLLQYGQTKTNVCRIAIQKSPDSLMVRNIIDTMKADAWGTLITSFGTYNTLRIYTKEKVTDSLYINGIGQLVNYMPDNYYYKWYTKGFGFPVLQINKGILESSPLYKIARVAKYKWIDTSTIPELLKNEFNSAVYPNPINSESVLSFKLNNTNKVRIIISNIMGKKFADFTTYFNAGDHQLLLSEILNNELNSGIYYVSFITSDTQNSILMIK